MHLYLNNEMVLYKPTVLQKQSVPSKEGKSRNTKIFLWKLFRHAVSQSLYIIILGALLKISNNTKPIKQHDAIVANRISSPVDISFLLKWERQVVSRVF